MKSSLLPVLRRGFLPAGALGLLMALLAPALHAQQYLLAPVAHQQFFTNTGVVAAGYKLCTFTAGTTTPLSLASDNAGTALPDPITLNAAGRCDRVRLALCGVGPTALRAREAEQVLLGELPTGDALAAAAERAAAATDPPGDVHASAAFWRRLVRVTTR